jgi:hypothetical protein
MPNPKCKEKAVYLVAEARKLAEPPDTFYSATPYSGTKRCGDFDLEGRVYYCYKCEHHREALAAGHALRKKRLQDHWANAVAPGTSPRKKT